MEVFSIRPALALFIPGIGALLIFLKGKTSFYLKLWGILASTFTFLTVLSMLPAVFRGAIFTTKLVTLLPKFGLILRVDSLGILFALVSSSMWILVNIYSLEYMSHEHRKQQFFVFFSLSIFSAIGIALAGNLLTLFLFYEMLTLCTFPLVAHELSPEAMKAGNRYLIYTLSGGGLILFALLVTYSLTGTLTLSKPGILSLEYGRGILTLLFFTYIVGFSVKAAMMPIHHWLPSAMIAPVPVSCLLHAVAVVKAGVFGVSRVIFNVFGIELLKTLGFGNVLAVLAAITIIGASLVAMSQDNLKRRLAYSTISQLSYIILGGALLTPYAALGALIHLANHAFTKGTLFLCAGIIAHETGKTEISEMAGVGRRLPITMTVFTIAALGMMGFPPLAGFFSKWYLALGALQAKKPLYIGVLLLSAILNMLYFMPVVATAFFGKVEKEEAKAYNKVKKEASWIMVGPIVATATFSVLLGILVWLPGFPLSIAKLATAALFKP